jgi:hypothetical protein
MIAMHVTMVAELSSKKEHSRLAATIDSVPHSSNRKPEKDQNILLGPGRRELLGTLVQLF